MSTEELDKELGGIPQPERIMLYDLYVAENRYVFPEEMMREKHGFSNYLKYCVRDSQSRGFHVISAKLAKITDTNIIQTSRTLILKVAKLPEPNLKELGVELDVN